MRKIYLIFSLILAICGLIIAFENIMISANGLMIFFETINGNLFFPLLFVLFLGGSSGFFLGLAFSKKDKNNEGEDSSNYDI